MFLRCLYSTYCLRGGHIGVGSATTTESGHDVHEAPVVLDATLCTASLLLLLLRLVHLGRLALDLAGTRQGSVHLTTEQRHNQVQLEVGECGQRVVGGQNAALARQMEVVGVQVRDGAQMSLSNEKGGVILVAFRVLAIWHKQPP